jgi:hypothetical protein
LSSSSWRRCSTHTQQRMQIVGLRCTKLGRPLRRARATGTASTASTAPAAPASTAPAAPASTAHTLSYSIPYCIHIVYSAFEFAEAESEKEELEDKLNLLLSKTEEFSSQINKMNAINADLLNRNKELMGENERLLSEVGAEYSAEYAGHSSAGYSGNVNNSITNSTGSRAMELLLSETRAKLGKVYIWVLITFSYSISVF